MRTENQSLANGFDQHLFALMAEATRNESRSSGDTKAAWRDIYLSLQGIRPHVRAMMSEQDRKETGG
jgi:hypothetical protein